MQFEIPIIVSRATALYIRYNPAPPEPLLDPPASYGSSRLGHPFTGFTPNKALNSMWLRHYSPRVLASLPPGAPLFSATLSQVDAYL